MRYDIVNSGDFFVFLKDIFDWYFRIIKIIKTKKYYNIIYNDKTRKKLRFRVV